MELPLIHAAYLPHWKETFKYLVSAGFLEVPSLLKRIETFDTYLAIKYKAVRILFKYGGQERYAKLIENKYLHYRHLYQAEYPGGIRLINRYW